MVFRIHNFVGVNGHFQAKRAKYSNFHIIETTAWIPAKFSTPIDYQICFAGGPETRQRNPRWRTAEYLAGKSILCREWVVTSGDAALPKLL